MSARIIAMLMKKKCTPDVVLRAFLMSLGREERARFIELLRRVNGARS